MEKRNSNNTIQWVGAVIASIANLIFNNASIDDVKNLFSSINWRQPDIYIRIVVNILFIASWLWIAISRDRELKSYLNARPCVVVEGFDKQNFNAFNRYGIVLENHPKRKSNDGSTDTTVSVDFTIFDKKQYDFRCSRWDDTFTRKQMRTNRKSPIENTSIELKADVSRRIAFFLGRFDNDENLYIHNDESYIDDGFYQNPAQIISEKEFKVKAVVNANHANNLIVWMEIQNIKNDHPKITIIKVERENNDC